MATLTFFTTTDLWSSRTTEPYISLTVHFVDEEFELKSRCLQTSYFDYTGENIAMGLREALAAWDLREERQVAMTTDNGTNVVKADLEVLESVNKALSPLQDFTDALSGERYVSISYVKPALHILNTSALAEEEVDTGLTKSLKSKILNYLNEKYEVTQDLLNMPTFLDPRFRTQYISAEETQTLKDRVISEFIIEILQQQPVAQTSNAAMDNYSLDVENPPAAKAKKKTLASFFKENTRTPPPTASTTFDLLKSTLTFTCQV
ncbi:ceramide transfer protein isoform X1 [Tachysurus ichikawai]